MNKQQLTAAFAALLLSASALHAQQAVHTPAPTGLHRALHLRTDLQAILAKQVAHIQSSTAQKPTEDERLVATVYDEGSYYDSTTYQYSGTRGSNLTTSVFSYQDNYMPLAAMDAGPYEQATPTLQYDTARYYVLNSLGLNQAIVYSRTYDAANKVIGYTQDDKDSTGALTNRLYATVGYAAGNNMANVMEYTDTSVAFYGMYQLTTRMDVAYSGGNRTTDTTHSWFGPSDTGVMATVYTYNTSDQMTVRLTRYPDASSGIWMDNYRSTFIYDAAARLQKSAHEGWNGAAWELNAVDSFGYSGSNPNYVFHSFTSYTFPNVLKVLERTVLNSAGAWDTLALSTISGGVEVPVAVYKMFYNANNHLTSYKDITPGGSETRFHYAPASGTGTADVRKAGAAFATIFPNPADNATTIGIANPQGRVNVAITNMAGQMLYQQSSPAASSIALHTASLPAGSYHVTVTMNGAAQTLKLVKQ